ncbi:RNA-binding protein [Mucilaginibacter sp. PAMB04274]|uniref:RNA recognition motif domain-containing protein n=1 Tax=Mucilaginibacter sp. PAMB04274 TaxID=3138568 RepID=UPI0031F70D45
MFKLFVVGFSRETDEIELDQLFTGQGMVKRVTIVREMQTGISKGYAFVEMLDQSGAERAIAALHGLMIGDRKLNVRYADLQAGTPLPAKRNESSVLRVGAAPKNRSTNRPRRPRNG